ncbi:hypothetical protein EJ04DRAFT_577988 [Polyplosphaeria fusca]|uniref:Apple domain-containing protein n=1 Tax=Polyplosphaeria fusca TaxID=682080 RepID=A0A9P4QWR5_9PLEO|nr:hypothetical protein EJ04DRAFT_577988 [Polyplosphaeria fusca]
MYLSPTPLVLCFLALLPFLSQAQTCCKKGFHNFDKKQPYMGNFFYNSPSIFGLCASFCRADANSRCKSFRFSFWDDAGTQYCEFFDQYIDQAWYTANEGSNYYYCDIDCTGYPAFAVVSTSTITITKPASTATMTSTSTVTMMSVSTKPGPTTTSVTTSVSVKSGPTTTTTVKQSFTNFVTNYNSDDDSDSDESSYDHDYNYEKRMKERGVRLETVG